MIFQNNDPAADYSASGLGKGTLFHISNQLYTSLLYWYNQSTKTSISRIYRQYWRLKWFNLGKSKIYFHSCFFSKCPRSND
jgi:hypothetical protein